MSTPNTHRENCSSPISPFSVDDYEDISQTRKSHSSSNVRSNFEGPHPSIRTEFPVENTAPIYQVDRRLVHFGLLPTSTSSSSYSLSPMDSINSPNSNESTKNSSKPPSLRCTSSFSPAIPQQSSKTSKRLMIKPERSRSRRSVSTRIRRNAITGLDEAGHDEDEDSLESKKKVPLNGCCSRFKIWHTFSRFLTCCCCDCCLVKCGGRIDPLIRQAWREKTSLCLLIFVSCIALGFLTFGLTTVVCRPPKVIYRYQDVKKNISGNNRWFIIHGYIYNIPSKYQPYPHQAGDIYTLFAGQDITEFFPYSPSCKRAGYFYEFACRDSRNPAIEYCHSTDIMKNFDRVGQVTWDWKDIENSNRYLSYNGIVLNIGYYLDQVPKGFYPFGKDVDRLFRSAGGGDATKAIQALPHMLRKCLLENFGAGTVDIKSVGCILTDVILYVSLVVILAVILIKFALAVYFSVFMSRKLCDYEAKKTERLLRKIKEKEPQANKESEEHIDNPCKETSDSICPTLTIDTKPCRSRRDSYSTSVDRGRTVDSRKFSLCDDLEQGVGDPANDSIQRKTSRYSAALQKNILPRASFSMSSGSLFNLTSSGDELASDSETNFPGKISTDSIRSRKFSIDSLRQGVSIRKASLSQLPSFNSKKTKYRDFDGPFEKITPNLTNPDSAQLLVRQDSQTDPDVMYTILVVTCYSEGEEGLKTTIESLVETDYPDSQKLLFIVADGLIRGSGNDRSTPEILIDMMEVDPWAGYIHGKIWSSDLESEETFPKDVKSNENILVQKLAIHPNNIRSSHPDSSNWMPQAYGYVAIADGEKRHNMARVFAGYYNSKGHRVPALVVVKCGTYAEATLPKPGNRGKRDSQIILMSFLSKVLFRDRMTPLEYDIFLKIRYLMNMTPDQFEVMLCVDADTKVSPSCLSHMTTVMKMDPLVMGLCGETKIDNKLTSWVTLIQVFEYFISHHLNKAFESIFGGVTCLPGCFCMYRIKAPKGYSGSYHWVPILASPDIVNFYAENVTDTLHKKNLLLLGEDRYLTTLLLKTFPKRKMVFVPMASCKTLVPDTFGVLLSQRRRWINSTVHNLFELVLVNDLCGTFCCSMQFVIFMELVGTLVLPAAILFTCVLLASSFYGPVQYVPLGLLIAILGLPAFLILFTARSPSYVLYMLAYLLSLPIWNFVLPTYAFWHFDDFSWGQTRQVSGSSGKDSHGEKQGEFDHSKILMKHWHEYERMWCK